jgi:hypothetical protein
MALDALLKRLSPASPERDFWLATRLRQAAPDDALAHLDWTLPGGATLGGLQRGQPLVMSEAR